MTKFLTPLMKKITAAIILTLTVSLFASAQKTDDTKDTVSVVNKMFA